MSDYSVAEEIAEVRTSRPHVVILGAGASRAAFPQGDRLGRKLPLMADFTEIVPIADAAREAGLERGSGNFEEIYSRIAADPAAQDLRKRLERSVYDYFDGLQLPSVPTIYDHLLLSMRRKDVIATFNWDPFLLDAVRRNPVLSDRLPTILFLHGNVRSGSCLADRVHGMRGADCSRCGRPLEASRLLYPVLEKNYHEDRAIADSWRALKAAMKSACYVTIFGYSAPRTDQSAMDLLREAWGSSEKRELEWIELIDVRNESELTEAWTDFICSWHCEVRRSFYDSWLAIHPRRTVEAWWNQFVGKKWGGRNALPREAGFQDLWRWYDTLLKAEDRVGDRRRSTRVRGRRGSSDRSSAR